MNRRGDRGSQLLIAFTMVLALALALGLSLWPGQAFAQAGSVHVVQRGETLARIAGQYGISWRALAEANNLANPNQIRVGQRLEIPGAGTTQQQAAPQAQPVESQDTPTGRVIRFEDAPVDYGQTQSAPAAHSEPSQSAPAASTTQAPSAPNQDGKVILISLSDQHLWAYENGELQLQTVVTTGRARAGTPTGTFDVIRKYTPYRFISPYPRGHEFWYESATANYSLRFTWRGHHIHDSPWRADYGPGTNVPHTDSLGRAQNGSIGCVNVPTAAMAQLYEWATTGTKIVIRH
jgi:LysM repeat protein